MCLLHVELDAAIHTAALGVLGTHDRTRRAEPDCAQARTVYPVRRQVIDHGLGTRLAQCLVPFRVAPRIGVAFDADPQIGRRDQCIGDTIEERAAGFGDLGLAALELDGLSEQFVAQQRCIKFTYVIGMPFGNIPIMDGRTPLLICSSSLTHSQHNKPTERN